LVELEDFVIVAFVRIELDGDFVVLGLPVRAKVVILLKRCGRRRQLNDYRPTNSSGMVAHKVICWLEKVLNTPRSLPIKSLKNH
jgi:hypothetical protein